MARKSRRSPDRSVVQNAVKTLYANIRFASVDDPIKSIVVTSSVPSEGKTTVSANLAEAIAQSGKTVLLVECDMRKRSLFGVLNVHTGGGLYSVLTGLSAPDEAIVPTRVENMYFLDAEPSIPNPADIFSSKRFAKLLESLVEHYDYVVLDTPPVGTFVDAAILSSMADATVFVLRENFAKRNEVAGAFEQLKKADAHVIGTVLNYCEDETASSGYYYGYYGKNVAREAPSQPVGHAAAPTHATQPVGMNPAPGKRFK